MNLSELQRRIKAQGASERGHMLTATKLRETRLDRWLRDPRDEPMNEDETDLLIGWVLGQYGLCSVDGEWRRIRTNVAPPVCLGVRPPPVAHGKAYEAGVGASDPKRTLTPAKTELPDLDELKWQAAKRKEEAEAKALRDKQKEKATGFKPGATIPLMNFGFGRNTGASQ